MQRRLDLQSRINDARMLVNNRALTALLKALQNGYRDARTTKAICRIAANRRHFHELGSLQNTV